MGSREIRSIQEIRDTHIDAYEGNLDLIESDAGVERQDRADYDGRFIFELLQNAVDEMGETDDPEVQIELTKESLIVANNGDTFDYDDLYALTLPTRTTKAGGTTIGYKGRGFTSVLGITDRPAVYSHCVNATFNREKTATILTERLDVDAELGGSLDSSQVPVLRIPVPAEPPAQVETLLNEGFTTVFEFPLRDPDDLFDRIERKLESLDSNTVALLPELQRLNIQCPDWERTWQLERSNLTGDSGATLIHIANETVAESEPVVEESAYVLFERANIDREAVASDANLSETEIETMGALAVGVAFQATPACEDPSLSPNDWVLQPVSGESRSQPPHIHVFLPTKERSPIPALITGTFQSDTSRRNLTLDYDEELGYAGQFNARLFEEVGKLLVESVVPFVKVSATTPAEFLSAVDPIGGDTVVDNPGSWSFTPGSVEHCLFESVSSRLATVPFIPGNQCSESFAIEDLVVPHTSPVNVSLGRDFVELVGAPRVKSGEISGYLPAPSLLDHRTAITLRILGADYLDPSSMPVCLEQGASGVLLELHIDAENDDRSGEEVENEPCQLHVDPILELLVELRKTLESDEERDTFDEACRTAEIFPIETVAREDESLYAKRARAGQRSFFIPPKEPIGGQTLPNLVFLPRELYHGTDPDQAAEFRKRVLPDDFRAELESVWNLTRFSFDRVYNTAIRPYIPGPNTPDADTSRMESRETLQTIRRLAKVGSPENDRTPESPLLYRSSRRPFFELSKLPIPAVPLSGGDDAAVEWQPAHRVYVGETWQAALGRSEPARIEPLLSEVSEQVSTELYDPWLLASPEWFGLDEADNEELEQWVSFFRWLGVAAHIRPLPFFAPDAATRHQYRDTEALSRPPRSTIASTESLKKTDTTVNPVDTRYSGLPDEDWETYRSHLIDHVEPHIEAEEHRYISQINSLEYGEEILKAAKNNRDIGNRLLKHLLVWWDDGLKQHRHATVAEFTNKQWRGSNRDHFFYPNERIKIGANLWLWQLRTHQWVPTGLGTVPSPEAWILPDSDRRRFSLNFDRQHPLLPFVDEVWSETGDSTGTTIQQVASALNIGKQLEQAEFSPTDAHRVLDRIATLLSIESHDLSRFAGEVESIYTRVAGLMPGLDDDDSIEDPDWYPEATGLSEVDVLCRVGDSHEFYSADEAYFVRSHSARERYSGLGLPLITLYKQEAPGFGTHIGATDIQDVVTETPSFGTDFEFPITIDGVQINEGWIEIVLTGVFLRLRIDRLSDQDEANTRRFFDQLDFVNGLDVEIQTTGEAEQEVTETRPRPYYIQREDQKKTGVFIDATLPADEFIDALARAYTDYLNVSQYYEGIYSLIDQAFNKTDPRGQILDRLRVVGSGATPDQFEATKNQLFSEEFSTVSIEDDSIGEEPQSGQDPETESRRNPNQKIRAASNGAGTAARSNRVPDLNALKQVGNRRVYQPDSSDRSAGRSRYGSSKGTSSGRVNTGSMTPASQEYRSQIDAFGMRVTIESEIARLEDPEDNRWGEAAPDEYEVWDVSTPETYDDARKESKLVRDAIENFVADAGLDSNSNPFDTDWPGFDVLTVVADASGTPRIDRCIELKTSGVKTRKPSLSWNQWKAARSELADRYYLYVVRNIRKGKSGDATLLEIPRPFQTLAEHRRERREREVQLDLRSFDLEEESIIQQTIEWEE